MCFPFILGADFILKTVVILDLGNNQCSFRFSSQVFIPFSDGSSNRVAAVDPGAVEAPPPNLLAYLTLSQAESIRKVSDQFPDVLTPGLGITNLLVYEIHLGGRLC